MTGPWTETKEWEAATPLPTLFLRRAEKRDVEKPDPEGRRPPTPFTA